MTNAVGAKLMTDFSQFIPSTVAAMATRLYTEMGLAETVAPAFNCVITNVPGPQFPLYSAGARLVTQYGLGPIFDGMGLILPVFSYCGQITISVNSCREMMPDPEFFAQGLQESFDELLSASRQPSTSASGAEPGVKAAAVKKPAAKKAVAKKAVAKKAVAKKAATKIAAVKKPALKRKASVALKVKPVPTDDA
jgi:hypothetical protein